MRAPRDRCAGASPCPDGAPTVRRRCQAADPCRSRSACRHVVHADRRPRPRGGREPPRRAARAHAGAQTPLPSALGDDRTRAEAADRRSALSAARTPRSPAGAAQGAGRRCGAGARPPGAAGPPGYRTSSAAPAGTRPARLTIAPSLNLTHASREEPCAIDRRRPPPPGHAVDRPGAAPRDLAVADELHPVPVGLQDERAPSPAGGAAAGRSGARKPTSTGCELHAPVRATPATIVIPTRTPADASRHTVRRPPMRVAAETGGRYGALRRCRVLGTFAA